MTFLLLWLRHELRVRWRGLAVLALLVAFSMATVLAALAAARRGESALDRLRAVTLPADVQVLTQDPSFDWDLVRSLPGVAAVAPFLTTPFYVEGAELGWNSTPPAGSGVWQGVERPVLLDGRLPDPARADEVVVLPRFLERYGKRVGDSLTIILHHPEDVDLLPDADTTRIRARGPRVTARIVGVIRSPQFTDPSDGEAVVIPSPGLFTRYPANFLGTGGVTFTNALVRLQGGASGVADLRRRLTELTGPSRLKVRDLSLVYRDRDRLVAYEAAVLRAFALAALAAAAFMIGQYAARLTDVSRAELRALRAAGLGPRRAAGVAAAGSAVAAVPGTLLGVAGAGVASIWMPIGAAAAFEPAPGLDADWLILLPALLIVPVVIGTGACLYALTANARTAVRRSVLVDGAARLGWPVAMVAGLRFALERGRGQATPVRSALVGSVAGVLGVMAALTFSAGIADAASNPVRYGQTHQLLAFIGLNGTGPAPREILTVLTADPAVTGADARKSSTVTAGDITFPVYSVGGPVPVTLVRGRPPASADEIALAVGTAGRLDASEGDRIWVSGSDGSREFLVSGVGFVPLGPDNDYNDGALITPDGYDALSSSFDAGLAVITLRPGTELGETIARLRTAVRAVPGGDRVSMLPALVPLQLAQIQGVRGLPVALGVFLGVLALAAAAHAVTATVRRRRHEIAVMRALGLTPAQSRAAVLTQALTLAAIAVGIGAPLGVALGRALWRVVAESTPLSYVPPSPLGAILLIAPAALAAAVVLAALPAHSAGRFRLAGALRAE
ncbi:hypothetical protein Aph01nite_11420 [Acrocarpospora phusangensis]|uniref:ABC3 transporter permease C-terminal domain-containing protein n=1 Tax=Acrocarpospora phusangensis TaxID=1070424 RepID=A0A919UM20_9ACTN|nr:FtsX-like permease family protein [Acrocarpospora phusangensis]GIH22832.1 hypothetical protein Aph01nite_11420 [Acrocarpospora phusangensis]